MDFLDLVDPGIVYEREDAQRAMDLFYNEKVDFIYAEFLSWSEDFAWNRFLRDCPDIPMLFCNVAKPRMSFETTLDEDDFVDYLCAGTLVVPAKELWEKVLNIGATQHYAVVDGDCRAQLEDLASIMGFEYYNIK